MPYRRILAAVDASPRATVVRDAAIALGRALGAEVILFRAVGLPLDVGGAILSVKPEDVERVLVEGAGRDLETLVAGAPAGAPIQISRRVRIGTPWRTILDGARDLEADLVMVGARGHSAFERILGTTASGVVSHADRSVLVVHTA